MKKINDCKSHSRASLSRITQSIKMPRQIVNQTSINQMLKMNIKNKSIMSFLLSFFVIKDIKEDVDYEEYSKSDRMSKIIASAWAGEYLP